MQHLQVIIVPVDLGADMCRGMRVDMCVGMCVGMCADICVGMCIVCRHVD